MYSIQPKLTIETHYSLLFFRVAVNNDACTEEGSPGVVCTAASLKKPLTKDTQLYDILMKRMLKVIHVIYFLK